jgi:hypothetical protein
MNIILKAYNKELVLYVYESLIFLILGYLVEEKINVKVLFADMKSENTYYF